MKGKSGKHLTTNPPFGFVKDTNDKDKWLIDEKAAQTVQWHTRRRRMGVSFQPSRTNGGRKPFQGFWRRWNISDIPKTSRRPPRITEAKSGFGMTRKTAGYLKIATLLL
jgi:hypothetical protein